MSSRDVEKLTVKFQETAKCVCGSQVIVQDQDILIWFTQRCMAISVLTSGIARFGWSAAVTRAACRAAYHAVPLLELDIALTQD
jgi:hypothetical protein